MGTKRVVLVEPGDVLLIGNAGRRVNAETVAAVDEWAEGIGLRIIVFAEAIDIDVLKRGDDA